MLCSPRQGCSEESYYLGEWTQAERAHGLHLRALAFAYEAKSERNPRQPATSAGSGLPRSGLPGVPVSKVSCGLGTAASCCLGGWTLCHAPRQAPQQAGTGGAAQVIGFGSGGSGGVGCSHSGDAGLGNREAQATGERRSCGGNADAGPSTAAAGGGLQAVGRRLLEVGGLPRQAAAAAQPGSACGAGDGGQSSAVHPVAGQVQMGWRGGWLGSSGRREGGAKQWGPGGEGGSIPVLPVPQRDAAAAAGATMGGAHPAAPEAAAPAASAAAAAPSRAAAPRDATPDAAAIAAAIAAAERLLMFPRQTQPQQRQRRQ